MRILHVIESMSMGGAERHLANLLGPLTRLGVENHVATLWPGLAYEAQVRPYAELHDFALEARHVWPALPGLVRLARQVDVVHTQLAWADIVGRVAAVAARRPSVTTLQTTAYDEANVARLAPAVQRRVRLIRRLDAFTARTTRRFFAVSDATRRTYAESGMPRERIEVIPNSVDLDQFDVARLGPRADARALLGCAPGELALIMVARLVSTKGHAHALTAVSTLASAWPLKLYIVGTGPEAERLQAQAQALGAPAQFLGARADVPLLLHAADLFLFPSLVEGMPLALIEAMAIGLPCLCSDIPENRETAGDAVAYAPPGDPPALAQALAALLGDEARRLALGTAARLRAARYSASTIASELLDAIRAAVHC